MIRPLGKNLVVRVLRHERVSCIHVPTDIAPIEIGEVLSVGPGVKDLSVGEYVAFHHAHLDAGKQALQIQERVRAEEGETCLLKWFDCLFVVANPADVEIQGSKWST